MSTNVQNAPEALRISPQDVIKRMNRGEDVFFVDARNPVAWGKAETKLPAAARVPADAVDAHLADIPHNRTVVAYCT